MAAIYHVQEMRVFAISHETPGFTDILGDSRGCLAGNWCGYLEDPDVTFVSYATTQTNGGSGSHCTGTFIGPNILITAAHCGHTTINGANPGTSRVLLYLDGKTHPESVPQSGPMSCEFLVQTLQTDTMVMYCKDLVVDGRKIPPGILFGYLDFDVQRSWIGRPLHRIWWNWVFGPTPPFNGEDHMIFSSGIVSGTTQPFGSRSFSRIDTTIWNAAGGSGSVAIDPETNRIVAGPVAVSGASEKDAGAPDAKSPSIRTTLLNMSIDTSNPIQINEPLLTSLNAISPARPLRDFDGLQDKDGDSLFDVQEVVEREEGEKLRDHYWLGFESERRNALWRDDHGGSVSFEPKSQLVSLVYSGNRPFAELMTHRKLILENNTTYRVSLMVYTVSADREDGLEIILKEGPNRPDHAAIPTKPTGRWEIHTLYLQTKNDADKAGLLFIAKGKIEVLLAALSLIKDGTAADPNDSSVMDFDTHDKRYNWRNDMNGERAFILPEGRPSSVFGEYSWAGLVQSHSRGSTIDWTLRNRQMALIEGQDYRMCFWHKTFRGDSTGAGDGKVRIKDGGPHGATHAEYTFDPSISWRRYCTDDFSATSGNNILQFGHVPNTPSYLVDDIVIEKQ